MSDDGGARPRRAPPAVTRVPSGTPRRADRSAIRRNNLAVVTRHLAVAGRASRAGIAAGTGLTNSTVGRLVSELQDLGLVREGGTAPARGAGRPGAWVELDGTGLLVVGCEVNVHRMVVRVCDLGGRLRAHLVRHVDASSMSAVTATRRLGGLCREMIGQATSTLTQRTSIVSVVAAVPGIVNDSTHTVIAAPNLRWRNFPFAVALSEALDLAGVPVTVGNDANFAALAEFWSGLHPGIDDLVYVTGDVGIGGGLIVGGRLLGELHRARRPAHRDRPAAWDAQPAGVHRLRRATGGRAGPGHSRRAVLGRYLARLRAVEPHQPARYAARRSRRLLRGAVGVDL